MKTISLFFLALILTFSGFSESNKKGTEVKTYVFENWQMMVFCDGEYVGDLAGDVTMKARIHTKKNWTLEIVTGTLEGTGLLEGESFEIKFHGKYFSDFTQNDFRVDLHFIAKGDQGTKIINFGTFDFVNGPISERSKCF